MVSNAAFFASNLVNHGTRAVVGVEFVTAHYEMFPNAVVSFSKTVARAYPVLAGGGEACNTWFEFEQDGKNVIAGHTDEHGCFVAENPDHANPERVVVTVEWRDADGVRWRRTNRSDAQKII